MAAMSLEDLEAIGGDSVRFFSLEVQAQDRQQRVVPDFLIGGLEKAIFVWLELRARRQAQTEIIPVKDFTAAASGELERLLLRPLVGEEGFRHAPRTRLLRRPSRGAKWRAGAQRTG